MKSINRHHNVDAGVTPRFWLRVQHRTEDQVVEQRLFAQQHLVIGRHATNTVRLSNGLGLVSRYHAEITWVGGAFWVKDLSSRNGTWLNGRLLKAGRRYSLQHGDSLEVGDYKVHFSLDQARSYSTTFTRL